MKPMILITVHHNYIIISTDITSKFINLKKESGLLITFFVEQH
jgi:hypothetical protein